MLNFTIPLPPRTKKNGQILTRSGKIIPSKAFGEYQINCGWFMPRVKKPIDTKVRLTALYYMDTHRIVDMVGLHQALQDVLVHYGILKDDNSRIIQDHDGSRVLYDKDNPRTEIEITEV